MSVRAYPSLSHLLVPLRDKLECRRDDLKGHMLILTRNQFDRRHLSPSRVRAIGDVVEMSWKIGKTFFRVTVNFLVIRCILETEKSRLPQLR